MDRASRVLEWTELRSERDKTRLVEIKENRDTSTVPGRRLGARVGR